MHEKPPPSEDLATDLVEFLLRFPSAPIHSLQRLHEYHSHLPESLNMHTYRVLVHPTLGDKPLKHIFLFHNGLNELEGLGLYYRLASFIIKREPGSACILRPFPSHLTRAPFDRYAETPLQRYLWDGSLLFQQFIRYMIETRWLLSAIARRSTYPTQIGTPLLATARSPSKRSRLDAGYLTSKLRSEFKAMQAASDQTMKKIQERQPDAREVTKQMPGKAVVESSIIALREVLNLDKYEPQPREYVRTSSRHEPAVHVLGYSLGGFAAQSIFMSWPSLVASCTTLLSGGALRELSPTDFADPEEWQTVLHSLRYELDDAMLEKRFEASEEAVAGIPARLFRYFQRIFYEVFQQEYGGSFRTRVATYRRRLLFVVGGDDSIVRTDAVLRSAPPGGLNLIEVGGLSHFLDGRASGDEETHQRDFWLPQVGRILADFSNNAYNQLKRERDVTWPSEPLRSSPTEETRVRAPQREVPAAGSLSGDLFEKLQDDMLLRVQPSAGEEAHYLYVARNEIPGVLLDTEGIRERARAFHHDEPGILRSVTRTLERAELIASASSRTTILLPWNVQTLLEHLDERHGFPSQSETAAGYLPRPSRDSLVRSGFELKASELQGSHGRPVVWTYDGTASHQVSRLEADKAQTALVQDFADEQGDVRVPSLPDCWVVVSGGFLGDKPGEERSRNERLNQMANKLVKLRETKDDPNAEAQLTLRRSLANGDVRVLRVSRARFNPRFRGQLVTNPRDVVLFLTHVTLCSILSSPWQPSNASGTMPA